MAGPRRRDVPVVSEQEEYFYRAMHYWAGAAWVLGVADEATAALGEVVERALCDRDERDAAVQRRGLSSSSPRDASTRADGR
jgi:hypothetical protein